MDILSYVKRRGNFPSLMMGAGTVLAGTGAAAVRGNVEVLAASVCLLFALVTQLGANYFHTWTEMERYMAKQPINRLNESKWSDNPLALRVIREAFTACLIVSLMLGLTLMTMSAVTWWAIMLGVLIYGINFILNYGKHAIFGTPWALVATFIIFGPIGVMGTCFVQTQHEATGGSWNLYDSAPPIYLGIAMGFLACSVHLLYSYYNYRLDKNMNPTSLTKKIGPRAVQTIVILNGLLLLGIMVFKVFYLHYPNPLVAISPIFLGFSLNTYIGIRMGRSNIGELRHLSMLTMVNYLLTGFTLLIVWLWIGSPDDSLLTFF